MNPTESRLSSTLSPEKAKYPKCERKKQHSKESLNYVCLTPNCKTKGLICTLCKNSNEHTGHFILPLRTFLAKVEESLKRQNLNQQQQKMAEIQKHVESNDLTKIADKLEEAHIEILSTLRFLVEELSEKIAKCEQEIINLYSETNQKINFQIEKHKLIASTLDSVNHLLAQEIDVPVLEFKGGVARLSALVKIQKNQILINCEAELELNKYLMAGTSFKNNMAIWEKQSEDILNEIFKLKNQYANIKDLKIRPTTAIESTLNKNTSPFFSPTLKTDSIVLLLENKVAKLKDEKNGKLVMLNEKIAQGKVSIVRFKIANLSAVSSMQIGICNKNHLSQKLFKFEKTNLNHYTFMISSNSFVYAHNDAAINNKNSVFLFKNGDEITLTADLILMKLSFKKKADGKVYQINLKSMPEEDLKQMYFCACLNAVGDKIQIII